MEGSVMLADGHRTPLPLKPWVYPLFMRATSLPLKLETKVPQKLDEFPGRDWPFAKPHTRPLLTRPGKIALLLP